jgi:hypothetical protein
MTVLGRLINRTSLNKTNLLIYFMKKYMLTIATAALVLMSGLLVVVTTLPAADAASDGEGCGHGSSGRNVGCAGSTLNPSNQGGSNEALKQCLKEEGSSGSVSCGP